MQLDPVLELALRLCFVTLFAGSLVHKLMRFAQFRATVANYLRGFSLSGVFTLPFALAVLLEEAVVVAICLAPTFSAGRGVVIAGMLVVYAAAMAVNLVRGNSLLDCGCSWGSARQPAGYELVARNLLLSLFALMLLLPTRPREMGILDVMTVLASVALAAVAYATVNRLFANSALMLRRS